MMGVFAEFEGAMIQERVRAGLERGEGKRLGRPPIAPEREERIRKALTTAKAIAAVFARDGLAGDGRADRGRARAQALSQDADSISTPARDHCCNELRR
jgi:DNA invertase Pin-like site-specific DNA recombinase